MIQSVERAVQILRCFGDRELLGVTEIASMTQLNKSTAFGLVTTLTETGLLEQDELTGRYRLGLELFRLGSRVNADTRRLVAPALDALAEQLEETVNFVRPEGSNVVYLVKRESLQSMRICTKMGQSLPMYCTAVGKAILAVLPEAEREQIIRSFRYESFTENTIVSESALRQELLRIQWDGCAVDREELEYGLICVAVAVKNGAGVPVAAISCSGPKARMTDAKIAEAHEALRLQAEKLSGFFRD